MIAEFGAARSMAVGGPSSSTKLPMGVSSSSMRRPRGPGFGGWELIGGAEFFVAEPAAHAEAFEDFGEVGRVGDLGFYFFADFVGAGDGTWISSAVVASGVGRLKVRIWRSAGVGVFAVVATEELSGSCGLFNFSMPWRGGGFGAEAEELTVLGESAVGSVEDDVVFVDAAGSGADRFGAETFQDALEGFDVARS